MGRGPRTRAVLGTIAVLLVSVAALVLVLANRGGEDGPRNASGTGTDAPGVDVPAPPRATRTEAADGGTSRPIPRDDVGTRRPFLAPGLDADLAKLGGKVGVAVAPLGRGPIREAGATTTGHAWSTIKVPILVTLVADLGGHEELSATQQQDARAAITASDNEAAARLFAALEARHGGRGGASRAVDQTLREAGDDGTTVSTAEPPSAGLSRYGQTAWSSDGAVRFVRQLARGCLLPKADTAWTLDLMRSVVPAQRWGPTGNAARKGGWGPEPDGTYLVRQMSVVRRGSSGYAMSIVVRAPGTGDSAFQDGTRILTKAAAAVRSHVHPGPDDAPSCDSDAG